MAGKCRSGSPAHILMRGHHAEGGETKMCGGGRKDHFATGGAPTADTSLKRGGRRSRHASGDTVNEHTGHPGYAFMDRLLGGLKAGAGNMMRHHLGMNPNFAEGGEAKKRGGRRHGRYADGGMVDQLQGMANQVAPITAPGNPTANLAYSNTPPTGGGQTPTMKRGGRRSRHAAGEPVRDQVTEGMHRAMGGAGKTRKHYPYT